MLKGDSKTGFNLLYCNRRTDNLFGLQLTETIPAFPLDKSLEKTSYLLLEQYKFTPLNEQRETYRIEETDSVVMNTIDEKDMIENNYTLE